jgi:hypothetical protein
MLLCLPAAMRREAADAFTIGAGVRLAPLDAVAIAGRAAPNRATLLAAGLLPALAGILDACISRLNALAAVLGKRMAVAPVGCSVFPAEKWRHWLIRWTSPSAAGMPWLPC